MTREEAKREAHRAFMPAPNGAMKGLRKVRRPSGLRAEPFASDRGHSGHDATLVETRKHEALPSYKKYRTSR